MDMQESTTARLNNHGVTDMNAIINLLMLFLYFLIDDEEKKKEDKPIKEILIENYNEGFYAWIKESNTFIGQAKTPEDLFELIRSKFPKQNIKLVRSEQQQ